MIDGIDISNNNLMPNIAPYAFVFQKATEGETYLDRTYGDRHIAIRNAGKVFGAYLFYRTGSTAPNQVSFFQTQAQILPGDIVALDFENDGTWGQYSSQALAGMATQAMSLLLAAYPTNRVIIYCNLSTYNTIITPFSVPIGDGLWIAEPSGTPQFGWQFWQYGQNGIDLDYANFSGIDNLKTWTTSKGQLPPTAFNGRVAIEGNMGMGAWPAGTNQYHHLVFPTGPDNSLISQWGAFSMAIGGGGAIASGHLWFIGTSGGLAGSSGSPLYLQDFDFTLTQDARKEWGCPNNTDQIGILIGSANYEVSWCLELKAK